MIKLISETKDKLVVVDLDSNLTPVRLLQEFYCFLQGCGYVFPKDIQSFEDLINKPRSELQKTIHDYIHDKPLTRWSPDCLKSSYWECPSRTADGKCTSAAVCVWKQGYDAND